MISAEELELVASVEHPDPHRVLGPHVDEVEGGLTIRAFRPDAASVRVLPEGGAPPVAMQRIHALGVFEARLPGARAGLRYALETRDASGATTTGPDAYAFPSSLGDLDLHLAAEGTHREVYRHLGAHVRAIDGVSGTAFSVWAPSARRVSVTGDFNAWDGRLHAMRRMGRGIWEIFLPGVGEGALYKFEVKTMHGALVLKADPYGRSMELRPNTASRVTVERYVFDDAAWMEARKTKPAARRPMSIYEVHLGSWKIHAKAAGETQGDPAERWLSYRELAVALVDYVVDLGFTHVELLPVMEHPFDGSWGYQVSGYFAPTSRYGAPDDLRFFIDRCHQKGLGVILDWTPAHFPKDAFALGRFDGSALYEHIDPRQGEHKQWNTYVFNYGRPEVKNFLIGNALYWLEEFHVDGLRVDAVASMLYLDYGADHAWEWVPNKFGGRENLDAVAFLRELCDAVHERVPGAVLAAEESTSWPGVTRATYLGGLGFDLKWNMGWMHDTLGYFGFDPIHRNFHHGKLTFGLMYAYTERFLLPLSHDEVVHLKKSLVSKMPGDRWKMHASLRSLYGYMWAHPGKKLLFMGGEIAQWGEWNFAAELEWELLGEPDHAGMQRLIRDINAHYKRYAALSELDDEAEGFQWIDANDATQSVASFVRFPAQPRPAPPALLAAPGAPGALPRPPPKPQKPRGTKGVHVVFVGNFTPLPRHGYRVGVPRRCRYMEVLNTDAKEYGGSGLGNYGSARVEAVPSHGFEQSIVLTLPPLAALWLVPELEEDPDALDDEPAMTLPSATRAPLREEEGVATTERSTGSARRRI